MTPKPSSATFGLMKLAMRRDEGYPQGVSAPCRLHCPCGEKLLINFETEETLFCSCGVVYTYDGWIVRD